MEVAPSRRRLLPLPWDRGQEPSPCRAEPLPCDHQTPSLRGVAPSQMQLRIVSELRSLTASGAEGVQLCEIARTLKRPAAEVLEEKRSQILEACEGLLELESLFRVAWDAQLWHSSLAILDFAKPYKVRADGQERWEWVR